MRHLIIIVLLFSMNVNFIYAKGQNQDYLSFKKPYYNKSSLLNRIVYLNYEGSHTPIKHTDYMSWILIAVIVIVLIIVLYVGVYVNLIVDKNKEGKIITGKVLTIET